MGLLSFLGLEKRNTWTEAQVMQVLLSQKGGEKIVNTENALGIPAMWAGFRMLGQTKGSLPFQIFEKRKDGEYPAYDHSAYSLLTRAPSGLSNAYNFKETLQIDLESYGNAFARIHRNRKAEVTEFEYFHPDNVKVNYYPEKRVKKYELSYSYTQNKKVVDHDEMIHLMIMSKDGIIGRSPINACRDSLGMMFSAQEYGSSWYANSATPSGIFSTDTPLSDAQVKQIKQVWKDNYLGSKNSGNVAVVHSGAKYQQISSTPVDSDFVKTMKWTGEQVAQILGIPPHLLGILDRSTNNNIEQQSIDFVVHCIRPRVKCWENEFNYKLFLTPETQEKYHVRYNLESLLRGDTLARAQFYTALFNLGAIDSDRICELEGWNKVPGGDRRYVMTNMIPVDLIDKYYESMHKGKEVTDPKEPTKTPENGKK